MHIPAYYGALPRIAPPLSERMGLDFLIPASRPEELEEQAEALDRLVVRDLTSVDGLTPQQLQQLTEGAHPQRWHGQRLAARRRPSAARPPLLAPLNSLLLDLPAASAVDRRSCAPPKTSIAFNPSGWG